MTQQTYTLKLPRKANDTDTMFRIALEFEGKKGFERFLDMILPYISLGHIPKAKMKIVESEDKLSNIVEIEVRGVVPIESLYPTDSKTVPVFKMAQVKVVSEPIVKGKEYEQLEFKLNMELPEKGYAPEQIVAGRYMMRLQRALRK